MPARKLNPPGKEDSMGKAHTAQPLIPPRRIAYQSHERGSTASSAMSFDDYLAHYIKLTVNDIEPTKIPGYFRVTQAASGSPAKGEVFEFKDYGGDPFKSWKKVRRVQMSITLGRNHPFKA